MKTETKTGRWKYAAIVLIVTLLVGLFLLALCRMCALLYKHRNED